MAEATRKMQDVNVAFDVLRNHFNSNGRGRTVNYRIPDINKENIIDLRNKDIHNV